MSDNTVQGPIEYRLADVLMTAVKACQYLYEVSDNEHLKYMLEEEDYISAHQQLASLLDKDEWLDPTAAAQYHDLLSRAEKIMDMMGLPFKRREVLALMK